MITTAVKMSLIIWLCSSPVSLHYRVTVVSVTSARPIHPLTKYRVITIIAPCAPISINNTHTQYTHHRDAGILTTSVRAMQPAFAKNSIIKATRNCNNIITCCWYTRALHCTKLNWLQWASYWCTSSFVLIVKTYCHFYPLCLWGIVANLLTQVLFSDAILLHSSVV